MKFTRILLISILILACVATSVMAATAKDKATKPETAKAVKAPADLSTQALTILDEVHQGTKQAISELRQGAKVAIPEVAGAVVRAIFWTNLVPIVGSGLIFFFIAGFAVKAYKKMWAWYETQEKACSGYDMPICPIIAIVVYSIALLGSTIAWSSIWFNSMYWMGIFDQKAYLAKMILDKLAG